MKLAPCFSSPALIGRPEHEPGFRAVVLQLSRRGMRAAGLLAVVAVVAFTLTYAVLLGKQPHWGYHLPTAGTVALWDKVLILILGLLCLGASFTTAGLRWGRLLVSVTALAIGGFIVADDVIRGDVNFSPAFLALVLLGAVGAMPYRPHHTLALGLALMLVYYAVLAFTPTMAAPEMLRIKPEHFVYLFLVTVVLTGQSGMLYARLYEQYRAQQEAEALQQLLQAYATQLEHRTEALEVEQQKTEAQANQLRELERFKARFFANISHEFRSPLTLILGPLQDAMKGIHGPLSDPFRERLEVMRQSALRLRHLIDQLLELARVDEGRLTLHYRTFDLVPFARSCVQLYDDLAERRRVTLRFAAADGPCVLTADPDHLETVLHNLLSNALKHTPEGGRVDAGVRRGQTPEHELAMVVWVRDTGPGIPKDELLHVFDRFYQGHDEGTVSQGSGIGLALAHELVAAHGGTLTVESTPGEGTTFTMQLPAQRTADAPAPILPRTAPTDLGWSPEPAPSPPASLSDGDERPRILVVEDEAAIRAYLREHLAADYRVIEAIDGADALAQARSTYPDLILSDVMMPGMNGFALCEAVKEDAALNHIPVILLTARVSREDKLEGLSSGADDYLYKSSFDAEELLIKVENLIDVRRALQAKYQQEHVIKPAEVQVSSMEAAFLEQVTDVIEAELGNSQFGVGWLADELGMSSRTLQRKLKPITGISANVLITKMRMERAMQLLEQHAGTVAEIAYQVGFNDPNYFSRLFKNAFGVPPSEFKGTTA